jgi:hypothetical protein
MKNSLEIDQPFLFSVSLSTRYWLADFQLRMASEESIREIEALRQLVGNFKEEGWEKAW